MLKNCDQNKTVVITGGSDGLGKALAFRLAKEKYQIFLVARNADKTNLVKKEIINQTGNKDVRVFIADLSSQKQIRNLVDEIKKNGQKIDCLVNNAGIYSDQYSETEDGIEITWAVNYLAPFLLTNLLLKNKLMNSHGRIMTVASIAHMLGTINFDDFNLTKCWNGWRAYCQSKLADILFTRELARKLAKTTITCNCLHPGTIDSKILDGIPKYVSMFSRFDAVSPEQATKTPYYLVTSQAVENISGQYFSNAKIAPTLIWKWISDRQEELWQKSAELVKL